MWDYFKTLGAKVIFYLVIAGLVIGGLLVWRFWQSQSVLADNPTDQAITFQIDGKEYQLAAHSSQEIPLKNWKHTLNFNNENYSFEKEGFTLEKGLGAQQYAILNPTQSRYVLSYEYYGDGDPTYPEDQDFESVYFEVAADYGLDETLPDSISLPRGQQGTFKTKLFRGAAYLEEYPELLEDIEAESSEEVESSEEA